MTWVPPSGRVTVPRFPVTPLPPVGAEAPAGRSMGGHVLVHEYGVGLGDRVAIAMRNYPEWMLAFEAITSIGGVAVAMNEWLTVMTSSPARTPTASSPRCSAVVPLDTAQA